MSVADTKLWAPCPITLYKESRMCLVDGQYFLMLSAAEFDVLAVLVEARLEQPQNPPRLSNRLLIKQSGWSRADKIFDQLCERPYLEDVLDRAWIQHRGNGFQRALGYFLDSEVEWDYGFQR